MTAKTSKPQTPSAKKVSANGRGRAPGGVNRLQTWIESLPAKPVSLEVTFPYADGWEPKDLAPSNRAVKDLDGNEMKLVEPTIPPGHVCGTGPVPEYRTSEPQSEQSEAKPAPKKG